SRCTTSATPKLRTRRMTCPTPREQKQHSVAGLTRSLRCIVRPPNSRVAGRADPPRGPPARLSRGFHGWGGMGTPAEEFRRGNPTGKLYLLLDTQLVEEHAV